MGVSTLLLPGTALARPSLGGSAARRVPASFRPVRHVPTQVVVKASELNGATSTEELTSQDDVAGTPKNTVFYGGKAYTEEEWGKAVASGQLATVSIKADIDRMAPPGLTEIMAFSGPAPEIINGRLAMLGVTSAVAAELVSGESVMKQLGQEPTLVLLTFIAFAVASLVPLVSNVEYEELGPFTAKAEMLNGRTAMLGFAALIVLEAIKGSSLLG